MNDRPPVPPGAQHYAHPQGKHIYVLPDGTTQVWTADGRKAKSSATAQKLQAGYGAWTLMSDGEQELEVQPPVVAPPASGGAGSLGGARVHPQSYEWIDGRDEGVVTRLLTDDRWVAEQKLDGMRCLVRLGGDLSEPERELDDSEIRFFSHGGRPLVQAAAALHFKALRDQLRSFGATGELVLDGELMTDTGHLWLFDLPFTAVRRPDGEVYCAIGQDSPHSDRRLALEMFVEMLGEQCDRRGVERRVHVVPQVRGREAKADLLGAVIDSASEGVCFKDVDATYDWDGNRVKTVLKLKVKRTVDCIVTARNVGEGENVKGIVTPTKNAHLAVFDGGRPVHLGSTSMNGKPDAKVGDVVEVEYLSWKIDGHLVQPNLLRIRDDKLPGECRVEQLVPSNKDIIEVIQ